MKMIGVNAGGSRQRTSALRHLLAVCTILLLGICARGEEAAPASAAGLHIPEELIARLQKKLAGADEIESSTEKRRTCKSVIRRGKSLLEKYPASPNRFLVIATVFESQKALFVLDDSNQNRDALFETCRALAKAPDEYAETRLPADVLLTQAKLVRRDESDTSNQAAEAITELVSRYEGTAVEAESLIMASMIAMNVGERDLLNALLKVLSERFADVPSVKAFLRERFGKTERNFVFRGSFTRGDGDGGVLRLPIDRLGHPYLVCFWSEGAAYLQRRLLAIKAMQEKYPGRFEVFSFNLDELPDSGQSTLRHLGLDWTPMKLPGGPSSDAYLAYGHVSETLFAFLAVNEWGHVRGKSNRKLPSIEQEVTGVLSSREIPVRDPSYFTLIQSLVIGDFLVTEPYGPTDALAPVELYEFLPGETQQVSRAVLNRTAASVPGDTLRAIQACFAPPAMRCRLSKKDALANYTKAEDICRNAIKSHPDAPDLYLVRNRRIIALMGMWKLTGTARHLDRAVEEAKAATDKQSPLGGTVVPQFCIARDAIRKNGKNAEKIIASFITGCGGPKAPGVAHAAAVILTLDAGNRDLYLQQRGVIMARFDQDQRTWPVASLLLARASAAALFDADGIYGVNTRSPWDISKVPYRKFRADFTTLAGKNIRFPADTEGKHNVVVFVDPAVEGEDAKVQHEFLTGLQHAIGDHRHKEMKLILVFLTDNMAMVKAAVSRNSRTCEAVCLPGGVNSSIAVRLGAFAADRLPKTYVVAPDGRIEGTHDGLYVVRGYHGNIHMKRNRGRMLQILVSVKSIIRRYDANLGRKALAEKDYEEAAKRLAVSFLGNPVGRNRYARECITANMEIGNWEVALKSSNAQCGNGKTSRPFFMTDFAADLSTRAVILENLGRKKDAEQDRKHAFELRAKAASIWEARAADLEKRGEKEQAGRWRNHAAAARRQ